MLNALTTGAPSRPAWPSLTPSLTDRAALDRWLMAYAERFDALLGELKRRPDAPAVIRLPCSVRQRGAGTVPWSPIPDLLPELMELAATETTIDESDAARVADRLLRAVGTRFAHSARVAHQAERVCGLLEPPWRSAAVDAAWLHDIGYGDQVASAGFHPLDGARWLRDRGWPMEICRLVAWHTAASVEGALRGLDQALAAEFDPPPPLAAAALAWADLTSSPSGDPSSVADRLADILRRYPPDAIVHRAIAEASPMLRESAGEIESRLASLREAA